MNAVTVIFPILLINIVFTLFSFACAENSDGVTPEYTIEDLGVSSLGESYIERDYSNICLGCGSDDGKTSRDYSDYPHAYSINNAGQIVGRNKFGFVWTELGINYIKDADSSLDQEHQSPTYGISETGYAVGTDLGFDIGSGPFGVSLTYRTIPYLWTSDGGRIELKQQAADNRYTAHGVNNNGQVVGSIGHGRQAAYWPNTTNVIVLNDLGGDKNVALAINNATPVQIVGAAKNGDGLLRAVSWRTDGSIQDLKVHEAQHSAASDINDSGHIVGWYSEGDYRGFQYKFNITLKPEQPRAFLQDDEGFHRIHAFSENADGNSMAIAINNHDEVVGYAETLDGKQHAFLFSRQAGMLDLNDVLPDDSGWVLEVAHGINDRGQIVGWGTYNGERRAFLLTPSQLQQGAIVTLSQSHNGQGVKVGEEFTLNLTARHSGPDQAQQVTFDQMLPAALQFIASDRCTAEGQAVHCDLGAMEGGVTEAFKITLKALAWDTVTIKSRLLAVAEDTAPMGVRSSAESVIHIARPNITTQQPGYYLRDLGNAGSHSPRINQYGTTIINDDHISQGGSIKTLAFSAVNLNDEGGFVGYNQVQQAVRTLDDEEEGSILNNQSGTENTVTAINNFGDAVGSAKSSLIPGEYAVVFTSDGPMNPLMLIQTQAGETSKAVDINTHGNVVANIYYVKNDKTVALLIPDASNPSPENLNKSSLGGDTKAHALNDLQQVVGEYETPEDNSNRAFIWKAGDDITQLSPLPDERSSTALDINNNGDAVGSSETVSGDKHAVLFSKGRVTNLNTTISNPVSWQLESATGINDAGTIVGLGKKANQTDNSVFMLVPLEQASLFAQQHTPIHTTVSEISYGQTMALGGDTAVIGLSGDIAGKAEIYTWLDGKWQSLQPPLEPSEHPFDNFYGRTIALDGNRLAVAGDDVVYVYIREGNTWTQDGAALTVSGLDLTAHDFGAAIDLHGDNLVVGAPVAESANGDGAAVVYSRDDSGWSQVATLWPYKSNDIIDTGLVRNSFGASVAIDAGNLAVGEPDQDTVHFFDFDPQGDQWLVTHKTTVKDHSDAQFGQALSISGDVLAISAPGKAEITSEDLDLIYEEDISAVHLFHKENGIWRQQDKLTFPHRDVPFHAIIDNLTVNFATHVKLVGNRLAVSAPYAAVGDEASGAVYVYQRHGGTWVQELSLTSPAPGWRQEFGADMAFSGDNLFISTAGAKGTDTIYTYEVSHSPNTADIEITLSSNFDRFDLDETLTYILTITNLSNDSIAESVKASITLLSNHVSFIDPPPANCSIESAVLSCDMGNIDPGDQTSPLEIFALAKNPGSAVAKATATSLSKDSNSDNNAVELSVVIDPAPAPRINIIGPSPEDDENIEKIAPTNGVAVHYTVNPQLGEKLLLEYSVKNWPIEADGKHIVWFLNEERQDALYKQSDTIDLTNYPPMAYTLVLQLANADGTLTNVTKTVEFVIDVPPWPSVDIKDPDNGETFSADSVIDLRYNLYYEGIAQNETDFFLKVDDNDPIKLTHPSSMSFRGFSPGEHTIEIRYKGSEKADAVVTFIIDEPKEVNVVGPIPEINNGSGMLSIAWLLLIFFYFNTKQNIASVLGSILLDNLPKKLRW